MRKVDQIIVGGGIAGCWMAFQCMKRNISFALISKEKHSKSSEVAAGIFNPILAARQKLSYQADLLYPDLGKKYHEMEIMVHQKFFNKIPVCYLIESLRELNDWAALSESHLFKDFVLMKNERIGDQIISDFGYLETAYSGWVDIPIMINAVKNTIIDPNIYIEDDFIPELLVKNDEGFYYQNILADKVVFCQGTAIADNPLTKHIRLKPAKGEVLIIKSEENVQGLIPQNGVFLLPMGNNYYKVGSTFYWRDVDLTITQEAREEMLQKLEKWFKAPFEIVNQNAGIRPSSLDRRPLLGELENLKGAYVFNGLGSKGVALAPHYSEMLLRYMHDGTPLDEEVKISRFK